MMLVIHLGPLQTSMISSEIRNYMFKDAFFQISSRLQVSVLHIFWGSPCAPHTWYLSDVSQYNVSDLSPPTPLNPLNTVHLALFSFSSSSMPTNSFLCPGPLTTDPPPSRLKKKSPQQAQRPISLCQQHFFPT